MSALRSTASIIGVAIGLVACASVGEGGMSDTLAFGKLNSTMDASDKQKSIDAIRANQTQSWTNANSGNSYTFTPTRTFTGDMGTCRDYRIDANVSGESQNFTGSACTGPRSFWQPTPVK